MHSWEWQPVEQEIVRTMTLRVRLVTAEQVARGWFASSDDQIAAARAVLSRLEQGKLLTRRVLEAHPILEMRRPLVAWSVGSPAPTEVDWESVAAKARSRWDQDHVPVEVYSATKEAVSVCGAFLDSRHVKHSEATHDLHFTEVYLRYRHRAPRLAARWLGEAAFPKLGFEIHRMKDPDAFIVSADGVADRVVEFAGSYDAEHLAAFHDHCAGGATQRLADQGWYASDSALARLYAPEGTGYELW